MICHLTGARRAGNELLGPARSPADWLSCCAGIRRGRAEARIGVVLLRRAAKGAHRSTGIPGDGKPAALSGRRTRGTRTWMIHPGRGVGGAPWWFTVAFGIISPVSSPTPPSISSRVSPESSTLASAWMKSAAASACLSRDPVSNKVMHARNVNRCIAAPPHNTINLVSTSDRGGQVDERTTGVGANYPDRVSRLELRGRRVLLSAVFARAACARGPLPKNTPFTVGTASSGDRATTTPPDPRQPRRVFMPCPPPLPPLCKGGGGKIACAGTSSPPCEGGVRGGGRV